MTMNYIIIGGLVLLSGLFSGLTLGLMGLNVFDLKRKVKLGDKDAKKIYPLRKEGNLLLCTLLLGNVAVNSVLAVFLGSLTTGVMASVLATGLIVVFGEIIPQSVFSRFALSLGAKSVWVVYIFLYVLYPVTKPLAWMLDKALGEELPSVFSKQEFSLFLEEQKDHKRSDIEKHQFEMLQGGLIYSEVPVKDVMTPSKHTFHLHSTEKLTRSVLSQVHKKGHSRIPVISKKTKKVVGILYMKDLVTISPQDNISARQLMRRDVVFHVREVDRLDRVLKLFKKRKIHLFIVHDVRKKFSGIVTLEDVLEEIVGEIVDEHDWATDMRKIKA